MKPWKEIFVGDRSSVHRSTASPDETLYGARAVQHVGQSACVSVAVPGEKVKSRLAIKGAPSPLKKRASSASSLATGEWPPAQENLHQGVIVFETNGVGRSQASGNAGGSACDVQDLETFRMEAPGWEEYSYKNMLALLKRLPQSVHEHASRIRKPNVPSAPKMDGIGMETAEGSYGNPNNDEPPPANPPQSPGTGAQDGIANVDENAGQVQGKEGEKEPPKTPGKLSLHAIYTAIKSWTEEEGKAEEQLKHEISDDELQTEEGLTKRVKELLSDQGFGRKIVEGEGTNDAGGSADVREWRFAIKKLNYKMSIGLVSTAAPVFCDWFHPLFVDKAWFWQCCTTSGADNSSTFGGAGSPQLARAVDRPNHFRWHAESERRKDIGHGVESKGFLANGNRIYGHTHECFQEGSVVTIRLDIKTGKVSFLLGDHDDLMEIGVMEGAEGVVGEVYPAVCLHANGDCVEFAPDPPASSAANVQGGDKKQGTQMEGAGGVGTVDLIMQTEAVLQIEHSIRPYHYAHLSTSSQVQRLLDDAEEVLTPYHHWPSMSSTGWIGKVLPEQLPTMALTGAKKLLRGARAILDGNAAKATSQVKIANLPPDTQHREIRDLVRDKCGFTPESVSLKLDRDFLHPSDRVKLAPSMRKENMTAFLTLTSTQQQVDVLRLDGELFRAPGLNWTEVGSEKPMVGNEIKNHALAAALQQKAEFSTQDLNKFKVGELSHDNYIKVEGKYYRPAVKDNRHISVSSVKRADAKSLSEDGEKIITLAHRMLSLEHDLRLHVTRLQRDTATSLDAVFAHLGKSDGSQAHAALDRAREAIKRLPPGELLAFEQGHLEDEMLDLNKQLERLEQEGRQKVDGECKRLDNEMEARLDKWRGYLLARGDRQDHIAIEVRKKRHELETEHKDLLHQLEKEISLKIDKVRKEYNAKRSEDLETRLKEAEAHVHAAYPWLNFYNVEHILGRLDWLLNSAEYCLRRIDRGKDDYIAAWECVTSARHIMTLPLGFDDRRKLGLDTDKAINALPLSSLHHHWHAVLRAFPERAQLVRNYDILFARLSNIERLLQSLMRPLREQVYSSMRKAGQQLQSSQLVGPQHVIEAARALRAALHTQAKLPNELAPNDLAQTVQNVNTEALFEIARAHSLFLQQASAIQNTLKTPLKDIYISFDCGPPAHLLKNASEYFYGGEEGRHKRSEVHYQQKTDASGWALLHRVKAALSAYGWTVHTGDDFPYDRVYQEIQCSRRGEKPLDLQTNGTMSRKTGVHGVGDYAESLGMRLTIRGDLSKTSSVFPVNLPDLLARVCKQSLTKSNEERLTKGETLSALDSKVHVEASRFEVVSIKYDREDDMTVADIAIHPTQTKVDRCSAETLASTVYLASRDEAMEMFPPPNKLEGCHWPWPLPTKGTELTDYDITASQKIQQSWAVVMLVTKRYMRACQDLEFLSRGANSKAVSEMRNAVWFKGAQRIVLLLCDDAKEIGVPFTWRGRMGDMLRECPYLDCTPTSVDACMPKLHKHLAEKMGMTYDAPPKRASAPSLTRVEAQTIPRDGPPPANLKPVPGGSLLSSHEELSSGFVDTLRSLHPDGTAADAAVPDQNSILRALNKIMPPEQAPSATISSALKLADSLQTPKGNKNRGKQVSASGRDLAQLSEKLHSLDKSLRAGAPGANSIEDTEESEDEAAAAEGGEDEAAAAEGGEVHEQQHQEAEPNPAEGDGEVEDGAAEAEGSEVHGQDDGAGGAEDGAAEAEREVQAQS